MPSEGQEKKNLNFVGFRSKKQVTHWPAVVKRADKMSKGRRYKSETKSYSDLWKLYIGVPLGTEDNEAECRGRFRESDDVEDENVGELPPKRGRPRKKNEDAIEPIKARHLPGRFNDDGYLDFHNWLRARNQTRKDLYWFASEVIGGGFFQPATHKLICEQFVQKNFDGAYSEGYQLIDFHAAMDSQTRVPVDWDFKKRCYVPRPSEIERRENYARDALILAPRGTGKSSLDAIDCAQWIINCPDIRIFILAGEYKLSVGFMLDVKKLFYLPRGGEPTAFHYLFPEFILRGVDGTSKEPFITPARSDRLAQPRFPTVWTNSIVANLSGWKCDLRKGDDVITDTNCNTIETRESVKKKLDGSKNLLDEWGWTDLIGTRYFTDDYYGRRLEQYSENPEDSNLKYFISQCWIVKPEFFDVPLKQLTEDMVMLTFPEKMTFKSLRQRLLENENLFLCQQLNHPAKDSFDPYTVHFKEDDLRKHLVSPMTYSNVPGDIFVLWDWALTVNKRSDFSAGVAIKIFDKDGKKCVAVLEVLYNKWPQTELAMQIVGFNNRWKPRRTLIENSPGSEYLKMEINRAKQRYNTEFDIFWRTVPPIENAKRNRFKGLETLLMSERLWFVMGPWVDETFAQMIKYTGVKGNKGRHDDIPDAMSNILFYLPVDFQNPQEAEIAKRMAEEERNKALLKDQYRQVFGDGSSNQGGPSFALVTAAALSPMQQIAQKLGLRP